MPTIDVTDANNDVVAIEKPLVPGRAAAATSRPIVLSTEDKAALDLLATALGEVAASPTANTVLDRLKTIAASLTSLGGYSDGLEALATTLNGLVDQLEGYVDGLETLVTSSNTKLDTLATYVDGLEALIASPIPAGTNLIGKTGIDQTTPGTTNAVVANAVAAAGGITSTARLASAAGSTNATNVKTSAGRIYSAQGYNAAAYPVYLVLYDAATNPPVPGTTTIRKKIPIPAGAAFALDWPLGMSFANGIGYAFTKLAADADTTVLVAGDVLQFNLDYV